MINIFLVKLSIAERLSFEEEQHKYRGIRLKPPNSFSIEHIQMAEPDSDESQNPALDCQQPAVQ
jgi:hypothetical protein